MSESDETKKIIGKALKKAGELLDGEPSEQALLAEYQVLQQDSNAMITTHWTVAGIFLGISTGVLGWLVTNIASGSIHFGLTNSWIITVFGVSMATITGLLICWLLRVNSLVDNNEKTMRKIESSMSMESRISPKGVKGLRGQSVIVIVYLILVALWLGAVAFAWIQF